MKPSWDNAPTWANWLAMDEDGSWCWFKDKPWIVIDVFVNPAEWDYAGVNSDPAGWRYTLEKRPNET